MNEYHLLSNSLMIVKEITVENKKTKNDAARDEDVIIDWNINDMVEVILKHPDDFLKVKETLTRIGIASKKSNTLFQSCHILHKQGRYFIVHFKELFLLDGKGSNFTLSDLKRRNSIVSLLNQWELLTVANSDYLNNVSPIHHIKVISFKDKQNWNLESKYSIGTIKHK